MLEIKTDLRVIATKCSAWTLFRSWFIKMDPKKTFFFRLICSFIFQHNYSSLQTFLI